MKKKTSQRKIESNRQNALKSTGPKTMEGKRAVRHNALKHGLLAKEVVIDSGDGKENRADFETLLCQLDDDLRPEGALERILVDKIASLYWRLARVYRAEAGEIRKGLASAKVLRESPLHMIIEREQGVRSEAQKKSGRRATAAALALPLRPDADKILRYESGVERQFYRALGELERLQRRRLGDSVPPPIHVELSTE